MSLYKGTVDGRGDHVSPWWETQSLQPFKQRSSICLSGATGSGKTVWVYRLLRHLKGMFDGEPPEKVLYCYGVSQPLFDEMERNVENIEFHEGLPTPSVLDELVGDATRPKLIILDDMVQQMVKKPQIELLLTRGCHHRNLSVVYLTRNLFQMGKNARTIALNTYYMILFENLRDVSQIGHLARQLYPNKTDVLMEAYRHATGTPYGYLVVDSSPNADPKYRLRTKVFPNEDPVVYVPQNT